MQGLGQLNNLIKSAIRMVNFRQSANFARHVSAEQDPEKNRSLTKFNA